MNGEFKDRRQYKRYEVKSTVFITLRPRFDTMGWLKDVSRGGVGFEYTALDDQCRETTAEVDIFSQEKDLRISRIACRVVYDLSLEEGLGVEGLETRRCGIQFQRLPPRQAQQIKRLLEICKSDAKNQAGSALRRG